MGNRIVVLCEEDKPRLRDAVASQLRSKGIDVWSKDDLLPGDDWDRFISEKINGARAAVILGEVKEKDWYLRDEILTLAKKRIPTRIFPAGNLDDVLAWIAEGCPHRE